MFSFGILDNCNPTHKSSSELFEHTPNSNLPQIFKSYFNPLSYNIKRIMGLNLQKQKTQKEMLHLHYSENIFGEILVCHQGTEHYRFTKFLLDCLETVDQQCSTAKVLVSTRSYFLTISINSLF